jgi:hypothetical protein
MLPAAGEKNAWKWETAKAQEKARKTRIAKRPAVRGTLCWAATIASLSAPA